MIESVTVHAPEQPGPHHAGAMAAGARCDLCPLVNTGQGPVPPTLPREIDILVVAEAPGGTEVREGATLIGASGKELRRALASGGARMDRVGYTNAMCCMPIGGNLKNYLRKVKKRKQASPIDCCRPRLQRELPRAKFAILMGGASLQAVGLPSTVMKLRGTPLQIPGGPPGIATPHAAFVMRDEGARYRPVFHADVKKGVRIAYSGSTWREPRYFVPRDAAEVANFLAVPRQRVAVDVETDGTDKWQCGLRRIGIGTHEEVMIYSPLSVRGHALLPADQTLAQSRVIADYFQRAPRLDLHNGIPFDSVVLWRNGMPLPDDRMFDTMVGHQVGATSEFPHRLDFLGSMYTDAPYWKEDVKHSNIKDDGTLDRYLSYDIAVTHIGAYYVEQNLIATGQQHIYNLDAELFRHGRSMSMLGIWIDPALRAKFALEYQEKSDRLRREFNEAAGRDINPASPDQLRKLLYDDLGLPVMDDHVTESDEPSTNESALLDLLSMNVEPRVQKIIQGILGFREAEKILSTNTGHVVNGQLEGGPRVHGDGRMRPDWRPGKVTGRWGSNDPNTQNIPKKLRAMFRPAPGNIFVAADMSAVELRKIALLSGDAPLMEAFAAFDAKRGPDVHVFNACGVFGCKPEEVTDEIRNFIKRFVYALGYDAQPPKIFQTLSLLRDDNLRPLFPQITLASVERIFALYWKLHPAIPEWKKKGVYGWRSRGYMETAYHKRKRFFVGGESATEMANFPIQGACADMQNDSIRAVVRAYPFDYTNHRGLIVNGHDQLVIECAIHEADDVKALLRQVMEKQIGGMKFPAEPKAGESWKAVS